MADNFTPEQRRVTMSRIRPRDTKVETVVRRALRHSGHRYRVNVGWLPGKQDIVFTKVRLVVFIDGEFWHVCGLSFGRTSWLRIGGKRYPAVWPAAALRQDGRSVLRMWVHEVEGDLTHCVARIERPLARLRLVATR